MTLVKPNPLLEWITPSVAATAPSLFDNRIKSKRVAAMCREGLFPSACQVGSGRNKRWKVRRGDILNHLIKNGYKAPEK